MHLLILPNDLLYVMTNFMSVSDKMTLRETCIDLKNNVNYMEIRIEKLDVKIDKLLNGRMYILCRLRLASLCGLQEHTVASIWSWVTLIGDITDDSLPILRQIGSAIYKNSITD